MNIDNRILTLDPKLVADVCSQVEEWNEELLNPWKPSPAAQSIAQTIRNSSPRMADALEAAGIFEPWAEMLHDRILNLKQSNSERGITSSEAECEARKNLIPCCWEMQEEWLAASCIDYKPESDPDLYGPRDPRHSQYRESEDPEDAFPRFEMSPAEGWLIEGKLKAAVRAALAHRNFQALDVMKIGAFLWLVERLPENHKDYLGRIELTCEHGSGATWGSVTISDDGLVLAEGEIIRGEVGTDQESRIVFQVTDNSGSDPDLYFDLEHWLNKFAAEAGDPTIEFSMDWYPDDQLPGQAG